MFVRQVYMDEKNGLENQERIETLLHEISSLSKENLRLRKLLEDNLMRICNSEAAAELLENVCVS